MPSGSKVWSVAGSEHTYPCGLALPERLGASGGGNLSFKTFRAAAALPILLRRGAASLRQHARKSGPACGQSLFLRSYGARGTRLPHVLAISARQRHGGTRLEGRSKHPVSGAFRSGLRFCNARLIGRSFGRSPLCRLWNQAWVFGLFFLPFQERGKRSAQARRQVRGRGPCRVCGRLPAQARQARKKARIWPPSMTSSTEAAISATPAASAGLNGSWKTSMPTITAVNGSMTPRTEVMVEPMR